MDFDVLIIGAGITGCTIAERLSSKEKKVLLLEKRDHVGGNCYDSYDKNGILIHNYGPHIFHTNHKKIWDYLKRFSEFNDYSHKVLAAVNDQLLPIPFNLNSIKKVFADKSQEYIDLLVEKHGYGKKIPILELMNEDSSKLRELADYIFKNIFLNYTMKQWDKRPEEIDISITSRVPVKISEDDSYFEDSFQGIPANGYSAMLKKMIADKNIRLLTNCNYKEMIDIRSDEILINDRIFNGKIFITSPIDEFFDFRFGHLDYRNLRFEFENHNIERFQPVSVVNYPNEHDFTRITEFKHMTFQKSDSTTILKEYPCTMKTKGSFPCYPIIDDKNLSIYNKYAELADEFKNIIPVGRLGSFKYLDMDKAVLAALKVVEALYD